MTWMEEEWGGYYVENELQLGFSGDVAPDLGVDPFIRAWRQEREHASMAKNWVYGDPYEDLVTAKGKDCYAVACWMCGDLVEVEEFRIRNFRGEVVCNDRIGRCVKCYASVNIPSPDDIRQWVERALDRMGPLGWWWWLKED